MGIGSESAKRKLSRMSFRENFIPRNFLAVRYSCTMGLLSSLACNWSIPPSLVMSQAIQWSLFVVVERERERERGEGCGEREVQGTEGSDV